MSVTALWASPALAVGTLTAEPDQVVFPSLLRWEQSSASVTVRNDGPDVVTLGDLYLEGDDVDAFDFAGGSCLPDLALPAGEICTVDLTFTPTWWREANEQHDGTLVVDGNDGDEPAVARLYASYRDPYPARLMSQPHSMALQAAPGTQSVPTTVVMRNAGEQGLSFLSVTTDAAFPIVSNGCTGWLDPDESCSVAVAYTPPAGAASIVRGALWFHTEPVSAGSKVLLSGQLARTRVPRTRGSIPGPPPKRPSRVFPGLDATLADLTDAVPGLIRGGPARSRLLPAFIAPAAGRLSLTLFGWNRAHRLRIGSGALSFGAFGKAKTSRLSFQLNRKGVALLHRPQRTRIKVVAKFKPRRGAVSRQGPEYLVKPPVGKRKRR